MPPQRSTPTHDPYSGVAPCRWPDDYVALDSGRMLVHPQFVPVFEALGWRGVADVVTSDRLQLMRYREQRANYTLTLPRPDGGGELGAYLKRHWTSGKESRSPGLFEADAIGLCRQAGVPSIEIIAAGEHDGAAALQGAGAAGIDSTRVRRASFFMSVTLEHSEPADFVWQYRYGKPGNPDPAVQIARQRTLEALALSARRFHRANLFHRDLYWNHFHLRQSPSGQITAHLLDLQRLVRPGASRWRWLLKDLGQFRQSFPAGCVSAKEVRTWWEHYLGDDDGPKKLTLRDRALCGIVRARAYLYQYKQQRDLK